MKVGAEILFLRLSVGSLWGAQDTLNNPKSELLDIPWRGGKAVYFEIKIHDSDSDAKSDLSVRPRWFSDVGGLSRDNMGMW